MGTDTPPQRLLTPSKVTAWLDCAHYLTLEHGARQGGPQPNRAFGEFAQLLMAKGLEHESACLAHYEAQGLTVHLVPARKQHQSFEHWVIEVGDVMSLGHDVIYQMPFVHGGMRGIADFLLKRTLDDGTFTYEPLDAKLARAAAKPGHVLQLCFYADAIAAAGRARPTDVHIWLGSGRIEQIRLHEVIAYWRRLKSQLARAMDPPDDGTATAPVKCSHCEFCEFAGTCEQVWRDADSLQFVAGIRRAEIEKLESATVTTLAALAAKAGEVAALQPERQARLRSQAALQLRARGLPADAVPPHHPLPDPTDDERVAGLAALPAPDDGDVFLDYEGHPFWRADSGLFFLFGLLTKVGGEWKYDARWAHDKAQEGQQAKALIEYFAARREQHPGMHVYHYNHTERSALEAMAAEHGADQHLLQQLVETGLFVDLLGVVRNSLQAGVENYGLKHIERLTGYERDHAIDQGAGAVVRYEHYTTTKDAAELDAIAVYNADDVKATLALRDWLLELRDESVEWRAAQLELPDSNYPDIDEQVARLTAFPAGSAEHLLGDLLGYWLREGRANTAKLIAKLDRDADANADDPECLTGLEFLEMRPRLGARGTALTAPAAVYRYPAQTVGNGLDPSMNTRGSKVCCRIDDVTVGWLDVAEVDRDARIISFVWTAKADERGAHPTSVALNTWVPPHPKPSTLSDLADRLLDGTLAPSVADSLLRSSGPTFAPGGGPPDGRFADDIDSICRWVSELDHGYLPIQGPPGTGKTYTGAHIIRALVKAGKRVGITAMGHAAIDNMLQELHDECAKAGELELLRVVRKGGEPPSFPNITETGDNKVCTKDQFNVVAGTTWLFASDAMSDGMVDVLIVDEAGQLGLADALAASRSAHNVVLLGDPLQLSQVSQASHPDGAGASVLEHAIGLEHATVPDDRGVFLSVTWRMHPDVCTFISDEIYEGRLTSHSTCALQGTEVGTGLRWLQATHSDRATESIEEAAIVVAAIADLIGRTWTDTKGVKSDLTAGDMMVVAPYNDQVRLLRAALADARLDAVRVGTVDKFQGQQAPVVFFTMTTSDAENMPRDADFLFSRNRLNVALSRAKCLAFIVCTDELLNSRARNVDEMRLISTLCAAVDYCRRS